MFDKGIDVGGNIEVFKIKEEVEKCNIYLSVFDSVGMFNLGFYYVFGIVVIRIFYYLIVS